MAYEPKPIELVARKTYSGLGADTVAPGVPWGYKDGKCIDTRTGKEVSMDACTAYKPKPEEKSWWEKFWGGASTVLTPTPQPGMYPMMQQPSIPSWVLPVALGGGALVLVLALRKRRPSNPAT